LGPERSFQQPPCGEMWETRSVFQDGFIAVISTAAYGCEHSWRSICERRVWPVVVVVVEPESQLPGGIGQAKEHVHIQTLNTQPSVEALNLAALGRPSWPNEIQMHSVRVRPVIIALLANSVLKISRYGTVARRYFAEELNNEKVLVGSGSKGVLGVWWRR
jgi:hypothetical protein